jgi:hypothetical protein
MTTFLGVSASDVCEWDTKPSATDPRVRAQLASDRQCHRGVQAAQGASEPSLQGLGIRHRPTRDRGCVPRRCGSAVGTRQGSSLRTSGKKGGLAATMACSRKPYAPRAIVKLTKRTPPRDERDAGRGAED